MKKVWPSEDQNAIAIPNKRNRHSASMNFQLLTDKGKLGGDDDSADTVDFLCDIEDGVLGLNDMLQFSTQSQI